MADKTTSTLKTENSLSRDAEGIKSFTNNKSGEANVSPGLLNFYTTPDVRKRISSLRKVQKEQIEHEVKYFAELHSLELKYESKYEEIFKRRREIIMNSMECQPNDKTKERVTADDNSDGLKYFWLNVFLNSNTLSIKMHLGDEDILKHLTDVTRKYFPEGSMNFVLEFHFEPNQYFTNSVLTKEYEVKGTPDDDDPFNYDGPTIVKCKGCTIDWKEGKNPTVKSIRKKKQRGIVITVKRKSFFNFFNPPTESEGTDMDEDIDDILACDFEIGDYIKERIIPRATAYYTKEGDFGSDESEEDDSNTDIFEEDREKNQRCKLGPRRKVH